MYTFAPVKGSVFVAIPQEDPRGGPGLCGELAFSMYGTREAATNWEDHYADWLTSHGFTRGKASVCIFCNHRRQIRTVVHGDDFVSTGPASQIEWLRSAMLKVYDSKPAIMGPRKQDHREMKVLSRTIRREAEGMSMEADQRHAAVQRMQRHIGLDQKNTKTISRF